MATLVVLTLLFMAFTITLLLTHVEDIWHRTWYKTMYWISILGTYGSCSALAGFLTNWCYHRDSGVGLIGTVVLGSVCVAAFVSFVLWTRDLAREIKQSRHVVPLRPDRENHKPR